MHDYTVEHGAIPAPLDYEGFPKSVCTSVNEVVCHGIPSPDEVLREGDIVNIDCSTIKDGFFSDSSRMFCIGDVSPEAADLVRVTKEAVQVGLDAIKPWGHLGDIGAAVNAYAREHGYTVVREFGGHGIGLEFHEDPFVSFVTEAGTGPILVPGLCFTIEPMINEGSPEFYIDEEKWLDRLHHRRWAVSVDRVYGIDYRDGCRGYDKIKRRTEALYFICLQFFFILFCIFQESIALPEPS